MVNGLLTTMGDLSTHYLQLYRFLRWCFARTQGKFQSFVEEEMNSLKLRVIALMELLCGQAAGGLSAAAHLPEDAAGPPNPMPITPRTREI